MRAAVEEEYSNDDQPADDPPVDADSNSPDGDGTPDSTDDSGLGLSGPPADPDTEPEDDSSSEQVEAPCGCQFDTEGLEDGKTYRCTDHDVRFKFHE